MKLNDYCKICKSRPTIAQRVCIGLAISLTFFLGMLIGVTL